MLHTRTPLIPHPFLSTPERRVWLKLENLQPSGSFKMRGLGALCQDAKARGKTHVVAPSGGNAGYSAALAARALGMSAEVVVPTTTPPATRALIARTGATLTVRGAVWEESNDYARGLCAAAHVAYAPAFDHPLIWQGNSTMIDEIVADLPQMDAIVVAVGGGGLLAGVLTGLARHDRLDCRVVACETDGAASFHAAREAGRPVRIDAITSVATSLGASIVAAWPVEEIRRFPHVCVVLPDRAALMGVTRFAEDMRQLVEPACGVALATAYLDHPSLAGARDVVVVVCGGVSVSAERLLAWQHPDANR